jgi:putative PIN family toxin of toxin-antitoxin system
MASRALFDANLYVSYLLSAKMPSGVIKSLFDRAFAMEFDLVLPVAVLNELMETIAMKPYLAARISDHMIRSFQEDIVAIAEVTPLRAFEVISLVRDPKDDYLIAHAIDNQVDYLVSGDKDLLVLGDALAPLKIRSPQDFLDEIDRFGAGES